MLERVMLPYPRLLHPVPAAVGVCLSSAAWLSLLVLFSNSAFSQVRRSAEDPTVPRSSVPRIWDEIALQDWALPLAALGVRPTHFTAAEYYAEPGENLRSYPVYAPLREPSGYWEWLKAQRPEPLVNLKTIKTERDWVASGEKAFREMTAPLFRTADPAIIARYRDPKAFENVLTLPDGSLIDRRWVVTAEGLMLSATDCSGCHFRVRSNGNVEFAGPASIFPRGKRLRPPGDGIGNLGFQRKFPGDTPGMMFWRWFTTPWSPDSRIERLRTMGADESRAIGFSGNGYVASRTNSSPYYTTKIPDLQNLRYSRYIDATASHRLRGAADIARYSALVSFADSLDFSGYRILADEQRKVRGRVADEVLYAIGVYLLSLEPPRNPSLASADERAHGEQLFRREHCINCHTPPGYTSGKLTLAQGYTLPSDHSERDDVMLVSVGTDPGLALKTRKGTGFYKIPSLRGLWYRPALLHDGSVGSLEEMFDPARLQHDHEPGGWKGLDVQKRAVPGHFFGLNLSSREKAALLAFLRGL